MALEIEEIPDDATVTRLVDFPRMFDGHALIWNQTFQFPTDKATNQPFGESVNWDKYAPPPDQVHALGCAREEEKASKNPDLRYAGYISGRVRDIRTLENVRGHGFQVDHVPSEGIHHAEVRFRANPDPAAPAMAKIDRGELKVALQLKFSALVAHSCGAR